MVNSHTSAGAVFLSYSRDDAALAGTLRALLEQAEFDVFQDLSDTLPGEVWWDKLRQLIDRSDHVVFLLSARSAASRVCRDEIEYAFSLNKQVFPVVFGDIDWEMIPAGMSQIHQIRLSGDIPADELEIESLVFAMREDLDWIREHTRLLGRAKFWAQSRSNDELLNGIALEEAEAWLGQAVGTTHPTALHWQFINASRELQTKNQEAALAESEVQRQRLEDEQQKVERNFRAGLDVISSIQSRLLNGMKGVRGVTAPTIEFVAREILIASEELLKNDPDFYPSSVQMQFAWNEIEAATALADSLLQMGRYEEARETTIKAMELCELFRHDEYNPLQRRQGLRRTAYLLALLGDLHFRAGDRDGALEYLRQSRNAREQGLAYYAQSSDASDFRLDLIDCLNRITVVQLATRHPKLAIEPAEEALRLFGELPQEMQAPHLRAGLELALGDAQADTGLADLAFQTFQAAADAFTRMASEAPDDLFLLRQKSICLERLGNHHMDTGAFQASYNTFRSVVDLKVQLMEADPANTVYQDDHRIVSAKLDQAKARLENVT